MSTEKTIEDFCRTIVPLRQPHLNEDNINAWLRNLEHWFLASGIDNDTRQFELTIAALRTSTLQEMRQQIEGAPPTDRSKYLKRILRMHFYGLE